MQVSQSLRRVERVRHEIRRREVLVASVERLGCEFIRIEFEGKDLADFVSLGFDDHVKFMIEDGHGELVRRDYTPRRFDPAGRRMTIDFAIHGEGAASEWARHAAIGQTAVIAGPRGSMVVPADYDWHLLVGDATAAPAIARRLAELPAHAQAIVVVQLEDLASLELEHLSLAVKLRQLASSDELISTLKAMRLPPGEGYAWAGGEASSMKQVRDWLLVEKAHPRQAARVAAYWKRGAPSHHEELGS